MAIKIGQKIPFEVEFLDEDGNVTRELDVLPVFSLDDPSMGELKLKDEFSGHYIPAKTGVVKLSCIAKDGGIDLLAEAEIVVGGKDAVKSAIKLGSAEPV
jgi:hypothetical protein